MHLPPALPPLGIPPLGFGTWQLEGAACERAVEEALAAGYRHLDTAVVYGNEAEVGRALRRAGLPREELWITTKVWREDLEPERVRASTAASLERLGLETLDLLLVHWPDSRFPLGETLAALEDEWRAGRVRWIGVSNFPSALLREACALAPVALNQVEAHVFLQQRVLRATCAELGVALAAYSPLARGLVAKDPVLASIGRSHGRTAAQVALRWLLENGLAALPKASSRARLEENLGALDFTLRPEDRVAIEALDRGLRTIDPPFAPRWDG